MAAFIIITSNEGFPNIAVIYKGSDVAISSDASTQTITISNTYAADVLWEAKTLIGNDITQEQS